MFNYLWVLTAGYSVHTWIGQCVQLTIPRYGFVCQGQLQGLIEQQWETNVDILMHINMRLFEKYLNQSWLI